MQSSGFTATRHLDDFIIVAGTGKYEASAGLALRETAPEEVMKRLEEASKQRASLIGEHYFAGYFRTSTGVENIVYMQSHNPLSDLDIRLLRVFSTNVAVAFDNLHLNREIANTQMELIHTLGEVVETRSHETGNHVFRVGECAQLLALKMGMSQADAEIVRIASPMHDLGKIGISDEVLGKPGTYLPAEFESMKNHTLIGHNILKASNRRILQAAATIALQHHERWDGKGYPQGLAGE
jgi:response regulator RpfG family c-di-GMP phosphodiesterase